ncbi:MAG: glycosyltransferase family 2 protein [Lachnospiraceae bacterium]|nr:glycosyltransferase family 2 protein [Lachnospiraceae bacterium]
MKIDIIIPVYKPDKTFFELIEKLENQTIPVNQILLMNTEEKYFDKLAYGSRFFEKYHNIKVYHLSKKEFDHGHTRHLGVKKSNAEVFIMMTQDAIPTDDKLVEKLVKGLEQKEVASAYARQLPKEDCGIIESYQRQFNYPEEACIKSRNDLEKMGIKTYFCSNVCCAYRREIYEKLGGFEYPAIFNEDMVYAAAVIKNGYKIAYVADACVYHSHNYTAKEQFRRNFDLGVSQANHPEIFAEVPSEGEGIRSVKATMSYLKAQKQGKLIPKLILHSGSKYMGYFLGKHYKRLPGKWIESFTMNKEYWINAKRKQDVANIDASKGYGKNREENR